MLIFAIIIGCVLDYFFGDPVFFPHLVVGIGNLIENFEKILRSRFEKSPKGELQGGIVLVILVLLCTVLPVFGLSYILSKVNPLLHLLFEAVICWQCLAARSLSEAGISVYNELNKNDLPAARKAVSMVVGRDTSSLDEAGVIRATVETIAENTSDGVIAPLLFLLVGGGAFGVFYKAVNTMDSMLGYKNERYLYFGRAAAKLDDIANFIPARLSGLLMIPGAALAKLDYKSAWRIFKRDRKNHSSPNSAHTESAAAGALGIQLGGDSYYFGELVHKPTIGDSLWPVAPSDILGTINLMYRTSILCLIMYIIIGGIIRLWL
jgi:adenosylcobinamide-phosphate synthase